MQALHILHNWYLARKALDAAAHQLAHTRAQLWHALQPALKKTPALGQYAGSALADFPVNSPARMRLDISQWNSLGISHEQACAAASQAEAGGSGHVLPDVIAGYSTGTSGTRGIFLASAKERSIYAGQSLAKLTPLSRLLGGMRVLLFLRANSGLYSEGKSARLFDFRYCPLTLTAQEKLQEATRYNPHILIAPAHVLIELAGLGFNGTALQECFYGAEPLSEGESRWIHDTLGKKPRAIYQATEGFLGFTCAHGRLHLNEDSLEIEAAPVKGTNGFRPIITDLRRTSQPIVRVLLDDFIEPDPAGCTCGFAGRTILPLAGRVQHLWHIHGKIITQRQITDTVESILAPQTQWAAHGSPDHVILYVPQEIAPSKAAELVDALRVRLLPPAFPITLQPIHTLAVGPKRNRITWHD